MNEKIFNPYDQKTYQYAKSDKITVVNNIRFYNMNSGEKIYLSETDFTDEIEFTWKYTKNNYKNKQDCINKYINHYLIYCKDYSIKKSDLTIKNYNFSIAQKEMMKHLSQEDKEKLTNIIISHFEKKEKRYRLKQEIFDNGIRIDNYLFSELCFCQDNEQENEIMEEYFCSFDTIETIKELETALNNEYLNLYPELKETVRRRLTVNLNL